MSLGLTKAESEEVMDDTNLTLPGLYNGSFVFLTDGTILEHRVVRYLAMGIVVSEMARDKQDNLEMVGRIFIPYARLKGVREIDKKEPIKDEVFRDPIPFRLTM